MAAPTNTAFATAIDLGVITTTPTVVTQRVDDAGTTYSVYYKFTAPVGVIEIGAFGFGDLLVYKPTIQPYDSLHASILSISLQNKPIQFPVTSGEVYFIYLLTNAGNPSPANLTLSVQAATDDVVLAGDPVTNDDQVGFERAGVVSQTTNYIVKKFFGNIPAGESGDVLDSNILLTEDANTGDGVLFDSSYIPITTITLASGFITERAAIRAHVSTRKFYVANSQNPAKFCTITDAGVVSSLITLTGAGKCNTQAPSIDESILYFSTDTGLSFPIKRWDIVNGVLLSDLAADVPGYRPCDIIVCPDTSILVGYFGADFQIIRYSAAGAVLDSINLGVYSISTPRFNRNSDWPNSIWVMINDEPFTLGTKRFIRIKVSDLTVIATRIGAMFAAGEYQGPASATPPADFGTSPSCPVWAIQGVTSIGAGLYVLTGTGNAAAGIGVNPVIRHDNLWVNPGSGTTTDIAIANPYGEGYLVGDE